MGLGADPRLLGFGVETMAHDSDYFRRRAADARSAACRKDGGDEVEVAGYLALACAALARRRRAADSPDAVDAIAVSAADPVPLMLND